MLEHLCLLAVYHPVAPYFKFMWQLYSNLHGDKETYWLACELVGGLTYARHIACRAAFHPTCVAFTLSLTVPAGAGYRHGQVGSSVCPAGSPGWEWASDCRVVRS